MRKTDKVNILYRIASGEYVQLSSDERRELGKYRVDNVGKPLNTKTNVSQYVWLLITDTESHFMIGVLIIIKVTDV